MKVVVAVKSSGYLEEDFTIADEEIDSSYMDWQMNESDEYAVEKATNIKEEFDDVEIVTVTIGPFTAKETINKALAKGADKAIRVWDDELEDISYFGPDLKGEILSAVIADENPDLVLTGVQTDDDSFGATGVFLASLSEFQWASIVTEMDLNVNDGKVTVHRELEGGVQEIRDLTLPAVVTVQSGITERTYVSTRKLFGLDRDDDIERYSLQDLGLSSSGINPRIHQIDLRKPEQDVTYLEGDTTKTSNDLINILQNQGVV